jgi:hypothetical protein
VNVLHPFFETVVGLGYSVTETFGRFPAAFNRATCFDTKGQAANDMCASCDQLIDKISRVERFFRRLEIYTSITLTTTMSMTNMIVYIYG